MKTLGCEFRVEQSLSRELAPSPGFTLMCSQVQSAHGTTSRRRKVLSAILAFAFGSQLIACEHGEGLDTPQEEVQLTIVEYLGDPFAMLRIERVVELETTLESSVGTISSVAIDRNGEMLVVDNESTNAAYRFAANGQFLDSYHKDARWQLETGGFGSDGTIVLVTEAGLTRYARGAHAAAAQHTFDFAPSGAVFTDELVFVRSTGSFKSSQYALRSRPNAIVVYDANSNRVNAFGHLDPRLELYRFLPLSSMAIFDGQLFVTAIYELKIDEFDVGGRHRRRFFLPSFNNVDFDPIWRPDSETLIQKRSALREGLHRFDMILAFRKGILVREQSIKRDIWRWHVLTPSDGRLYSLNRLRLLIGEPKIADKDVTGVVGDGIVGTYENGIILAIADHKRVQSYVTTRPEFAGIEFNPLDNPLLVFLEIGLERLRRGSAVFDHVTDTGRAGRREH